MISFCLSSPYKATGQAGKAKNILNILFILSDSIYYYLTYIRTRHGSLTSDHRPLVFQHPGILAFGPPSLLASQLPSLLAFYPQFVHQLIETGSTDAQSGRRTCQIPLVL